MKGTERLLSSGRLWGSVFPLLSWSGACLLQSVLGWCIEQSCVHVPLCMCGSPADTELLKGEEHV